MIWLCILGGTLVLYGVLNGIGLWLERLDRKRTDAEARRRFAQDAYEKEQGGF